MPTYHTYNEVHLSLDRAELYPLCGVSKDVIGGLRVGEYYEMGCPSCTILSLLVPEGEKVGYLMLYFHRAIP